MTKRQQQKYPAFTLSMGLLIATLFLSCDTGKDRDSSPSSPGPGENNTIDTSAPNITIITPMRDIFTSNSASISLAGTVSDGVGVTQITWSNSIDGNKETAAASDNIILKSWMIDNIPLQSGLNVVTVTAYDAANNIRNGYRIYSL